MLWAERDEALLLRGIDRLLRLPLCPQPLANLPSPPPSGQAQRSSTVSMAVSKPSKAMPFLTAPSCQSSGLAGAEAGFDPFYFSDFFDIKWMREAELKHGRICMLASTGIIVQEFFSLPGYPYYTPNAVEACSTVPGAAWAQIIFLMAWFESNFNDSGMSMSTM